MDELIRINFDSDRPTVSGRDLHAALELKTAYKDWFPRMCDYGFEEGTDFCSFFERKYRWKTCNRSSAYYCDGKGTLYDSAFRGR